MSNPSVQEDARALMEAVRRRDVLAVRQILALPAADQGATATATSSAATVNTALTETTAQIDSTTSEAGVEQQTLRTNTLLAAVQTGGHTALHPAALGGYDGVVAELLAAGASVDMLVNNNRSALQLAAASGNSSTVKQLLEAGADILAADSIDATALHWAALSGHASVVQLLLDEGAAVNTGTGRSTGTPLHMAASNDHAAAAAALIEGGADVNSVDFYGSNSLHSAAAFGKAGCIPLLLKAGVAVNALNNIQQAALQIAAQSGVTDVVKLLLAAGADVGLGWCKGGGLAAAAHTACHGQREVFDLFMDHISSAKTIDAAVTAEALVVAAGETAEDLRDVYTDAQRSVVYRLLEAAAKQDTAATQAALQQRHFPQYSPKAAGALLAGVLLDMVVEMSAVQVTNRKAQSTTMRDMLVNVAMAQQQQQPEEQQPEVSG